MMAVIPSVPTLCGVELGLDDGDVALDVHGLLRVLVRDLRLLLLRIVTHTNESTSAQQHHTHTPPHHASASAHQQQPAGQTIQPFSQQAPLRSGS
jgi:hypothetical protein